MHGAPGFVSDESSSLWFLEELSRNEEPSRWIPDLLWTHDLRQFWRFCGMESRSKHKIVAKGSRLRVAHPPPEGPGPPRSPRHLLRTGFPHRRRFSQMSRIHYNFHNNQMCLYVSVRELFFFRTPPVLSQILELILKMLRWEVLSSLLLFGFDSVFCKMLLCVPLSAFAAPPMWCWWWWCAADSDISSQWMGFGAKPGAFPRPLPLPPAPVS